MLNESEALKIAITLTEESRYQRKKMREQQADTPSNHKGEGGLQSGFEQDFEFGNEEDEETDFTTPTEWVD